MKKKLNILYIARNIPVPQITDNNDILLRIAKDIKQKEDITLDIWFPKEVIPSLPFLPSRIKSILELPKNFISYCLPITAIKYIRIPKFNWSYVLLNSFWFLNSNFEKDFKNYHVIHAHSVMPDGGMGLELKNKFKVPLITTIRNGDLDKMSKLKKNSKQYLKYIEVLANSDRIIVHNYAAKKLAEKMKLEYSEIPHGIKNDQVFHITENKSNTILCVSGFIPRKNLDWLIEAFNEIDNNNWKLEIIGEGPLFKDIESLCNSKNIILHGKKERKDVLTAMRKAKIFVLPSDNETFGLVYLEAAMSKCSIIGKRYTGIYSWLEENKEALFIDNKKELKEKLVTLMTNEGLRYSLAEAGYNKVTKEFLWENQIEKYVAEYRKYGLYK